LPKSSPNLIQNEFNGDSNLELSSPKIKKIMESFYWCFKSYRKTNRYNSS